MHKKKDRLSGKLTLEQLGFAFLSGITWVLGRELAFSLPFWTFSITFPSIPELVHKHSNKTPPTLNIPTPMPTHSPTYTPAHIYLEAALRGSALLWASRTPGRGGRRRDNGQARRT
jgi:hypothetical protein